MNLYEIIGTVGIIALFIMVALSLKYSNPCEDGQCKK